MCSESHFLYGNKHLIRKLYLQLTNVNRDNSIFLKILCCYFGLYGCNIAECEKERQQHELSFRARRSEIPVTALLRSRFRI